MITIYNTKKAEKRDNALYILSELRGLSTDEKPTKIDENNIDNGSVFIEMDTQDIYFYDLDNEEWLNPNVDNSEAESDDSEGD